MDLQRAIRYVKYHGEAWGLGGLDVVGAAGFSGGGGNVCTVIEKYYGDITPDQFDPDYVCDEIDAVNSDMQIAMADLQRACAGDGKPQYTASVYCCWRGGQL